MASNPTALSKFFVTANGTKFSELGDMSLEEALFLLAPKPTSKQAESLKAPALAGVLDGGMGIIELEVIGPETLTAAKAQAFAADLLYELGTFTIESVESTAHQWTHGAETFTDSEMSALAEKTSGFHPGAIFEGLFDPITNTLKPIVWAVAVAIVGGTVIYAYGKSK